MPNLNALYTAAGLVALTLLQGSPAWCQESRWFRVELLVFTNEAPVDQSTPSPTAEQWDPTPELAYPGAARFLIYPELVAENLRTYTGTSLVDEYGRQIITLPEPAQPADTATITPLRPVMEPEAIAAAPDIPRANDSEAPGDRDAPAATVETSPSDAPAEEMSMPRPFVVLPASYLEFRGKAALMQRSGRHTVLFHESWVQPVPAQAQSLPIVLDRSGDSGQWPPLQGSIKLYLSRYLQVETNLWLNTAGSYLPGNWQMPAPPLGPPSLIIEEPLPPVIEAQELEAASEADTAAVSAATATVADAVTDGAASQPPDWEDGQSDEQSSTEPSQGDEEPLAEVIPELEAGPVYPYRHAVPLQQKRRMRSNEVHYIDHPLLGAVIKFTPVTADDLAAIAAEQPPLPTGQLP